MSSGEEHDAKVAVSSETRPTDLPTTAALSSPTTKEQDNGETAASSALPSGATTPALPDLTMPDKVVEALRSASFPTANGSTSTGDENDKTTDRAVILGIAVVDFNHLVGPQVEYAHPKELAEDEELCGKLPFLALPDGSHLSDEDFCYFHIESKALHPATVFGISCNRQIASSQLAVRGKEVTRSTVQKAVVVLARDPVFGPIKEKLGVVTRAFFAQGDFGDTDILIEFHATLEAGLRAARGLVANSSKVSVATAEGTSSEEMSTEAKKASKANDLHDEREAVMYMGTSLRELIYKWRFKTLMLLKLLLLQKKIMFFGYPVERLCTYQYSLVSLVPDLMLALEDSGSPSMDRQSSKRKRPESLKTSDRRSLLRFMGLPLHLFGQGAFFQPYLPLQQIDVASKAESYLVGTTNSIFRQQKEMAVDVVVDLEQTNLEFIDPKLQHIVSLTAADRKWMDEVVNVVLETWNPLDPSRPSTMQYSGSDDFLRAKFEGYICAMLSTVKYHEHLSTSPEAPAKPTVSTPSLTSSNVVLPPLETQSYPPSTTSSTPAAPPRDIGVEAFGGDFVDAFKATKAYALWDATTDPMLCDIVPHKHPCEGRTSTLEDVSLRLTAGFHDLHLDEQLGPTREALGNAWQQGSQTAWKLANKWGNDLAKFRRDQIAKAAEARDNPGQVTAAAEDEHSPEKGIHHVSTSATSSTDGSAETSKDGVKTAEVMASAQALQAQAQAAAAQAGTHVRQALGNFGSFWSARQKAWSASQVPSAAAPTTAASAAATTAATTTANENHTPTPAYQPRIPKSPTPAEDAQTKVQSSEP